MRQVSIKDLYKNLSREVLDLPFEVTRKGVRVGFVVSGLDCTYPGLDNNEKQATGLDTESSLKKSLQEIRDEVDEKVQRKGSNPDRGAVTSLTGHSGEFSKARQVGKSNSK